MAKKSKWRERDDDRPMNEAEWEAMFRESDVRAAKFGELLETLADDPDHEQKIAQEMGWKHMLEGDDDTVSDQSDDGDDEEPFNGREFICKIEEAVDSMSGEEWAEIDRELEESEAALEQIAAYRRAYDLALRLHHTLKPLLGDHIPGDPDDEEMGEVLGDAWIACHETAVNIAGGHGMGYDEEVLCANIVKNRMAREAIERCRKAWLELRERGFVPAEEADRFIPEMYQIGKLIDDRIAEMRSKVWW